MVTYTAKKPHKKIFTEEDLYKTDTFSFGTQIGQITNATSTCIGLMGLFDKDSDQYKLLMNRVKMGCAAQSRQIDKTKIGETVKGIPTIWKQYQKATDQDSDEEKKEKNFYNSILVDKKPYFFRYKYKTLNKQINDYIKKSNEDCIIRFNINLKDLLGKEKQLLTKEEKIFIELYYKYLPVLDSPCVMNKICHYIEDQDFKIKQMVKTQSNFDYNYLMSDNFNINKKIYKDINMILYDFFKQRKESKNNSTDVSLDKETTKNYKDRIDKDNKYIQLKRELEAICSNEEILTNHLIYIFYVEKPSYSKSVLWAIVGKQIYNNILKKTKSYYFPQKNSNGSLNFLYENYSIERVLIEEGQS